MCIIWSECTSASQTEKSIHPDHGLMWYSLYNWASLFGSLYVWWLKGGKYCIEEHIAYFPAQNILWLLKWVMKKSVLWWWPWLASFLALVSLSEKWGDTSSFPPVTKCIWYNCIRNGEEECGKLFFNPPIVYLKESSSCGIRFHYAISRYAMLLPIICKSLCIFCPTLLVRT